MRLFCLLVYAHLVSQLTAAPYLSPQEAVAKMSVPEGFKVDLLASEPDLVQPIAFCWDARGRIWVVEGNTYPARQGTAPAGTSPTPTEAQLKDIYGGKDRILILEDTDHDGSFDKRTVFVDGLNLVSGIEIGFGGVYIGAAPYLLHIPVKPGEDKPAGPPQILLDGWGYQDTHETLNSFIWGPDGWLYGCHGVFTHSNVGAPGTPADKRTKLNCAYWRYHPIQKKFDIYAHGTSNSWGFDYNASGDWFSEACVIPHFWHIIQGAYYLRQSNPLGHFNPYVYKNIETIADHQHFVGSNPHGGNGVSDESGGGHAHCGLCIYDGDNFPTEYRGRPMMFNIHGQRINQENLVPKGSGYVAKHLPDFLRTNDPNFTGVSLKVGPDGALYFIDWYDKLKCHRPNPAEWDRSNGRMYRVKFAATWKPYQGEDVSKADQKRLDEFLGWPNVWQRRMARRVAMERSVTAIDTSSVVPPLNLIAQMPAGTAKLEALWRYVSCGGKGSWNLVPTPGNADPAFNSWINQLIPGSAGESTQSLRLALASAITQLPIAERWIYLERLLKYAEDATDHNLPQMYWYAMEPCVAAEPARALKLAQASRIPLITSLVARRLAEMENGLNFLLQATSELDDPALMLVFLQAAADGLQGRIGVPAPTSWEGAYTKIEQTSAKANATQANTLRELRLLLAVCFGDQRARPTLREQVLNPKLPVARRQTAWQSLVRSQDPELAAMILKLLDDPDLRLDALKAMSQASSSLPK
jgi:putative membrane-bound dehydrogenase-like protein